MVESDILVERLEKKLIEKDKEIAELKRMLSAKESEIEEIKKNVAEKVRSELASELEKIKELESKIIELNKIVESLTSEILYLKAELKKPETKFEISEPRREEKRREKIKGAGDEEGEEDIIVCD